ncbi:unnamed protein product [Effrenium voratum]|nr:unnamed protein product [Effrenium voratum]
MDSPPTEPRKDLEVPSAFSGWHRGRRSIEAAPEAKHGPAARKLQQALQQALDPGQLEAAPLQKALQSLARTAQQELAAGHLSKRETLQSIGVCQELVKQIAQLEWHARRLLKPLKAAKERTAASEQLLRQAAGLETWHRQLARSLALALTSLGLGRGPCCAEGQGARLAGKEEEEKYEEEDEEEEILYGECDMRNPSPDTSLDPCGSASGLSAPRMLNAPSPRAEDAELVFWEEGSFGPSAGIFLTQEQEHSSVASSASPLVPSVASSPEPEQLYPGLTLSARRSDIWKPRPVPTSAGTSRCATPATPMRTQTPKADVKALVLMTPEQKRQKDREKERVERQIITRRAKLPISPGLENVILDQNGELKRPKVPSRVKQRVTSARRDQEACLANDIAKDLLSRPHSASARGRPRPTAYAVAPKEMFDGTLQDMDIPVWEEVVGNWQTRLAEGGPGFALAPRPAGEVEDVALAAERPESAAAAPATEQPLRPSSPLCQEKFRAWRPADWLREAARKPWVDPDQVMRHYHQLCR